MIKELLFEVDEAVKGGIAFLIPPSFFHLFAMFGVTFYIKW